MLHTGSEQRYTYKYLPVLFSILLPTLAIGFPQCGHFLSVIVFMRASFSPVLTKNNVISGHQGTKEIREDLLLVGEGTYNI